MNPFQAIMGMQQGQPAPMQGLNGLFGQAQQLAGMLRNPQMLVQKYFPDAPAEVTGDPDSLLGWMQQTGRTNPQMVQMVRQMIGR